MRTGNRYNMMTIIGSPLKAMGVKHEDLVCVFLDDAISWVLKITQNPAARNRPLGSGCWRGRKMDVNGNLGHQCPTPQIT